MIASIRISNTHDMLLSSDGIWSSETLPETAKMLNDRAADIRRSWVPSMGAPLHLVFNNAVEILSDFDIELTKPIPDETTSEDTAY